MFKIQIPGLSGHLKEKRTIPLAILFASMAFLFVFPTACFDYHADDPIVFETDSVTDIDGNVYKTVKIGDQWWMAENLKVSRYRNGDSIAYVGSKDNYKYIFDTVKWKNLKDTGAYSIIDGGDSLASNYKGKKFGFLYNGYAISNRAIIAPVGWHVPSDEEWKELEIFLGLPKDEADKVNWRGSTEGNKLKLQGTTLWEKPSDEFEVWGTNESGFSAIAGSCVMFDGNTVEQLQTGFWWTSTLNNDQIWYRHLDYNKPNIFRYYGPLTYGFSVRCIKD